MESITPTKPRSASVEVLYHTRSSPTLNRHGKLIEFGVQGTYLSLDPDPQFRLKIKSPRRGSDCSRGYLSLPVGNGSNILLSIEDAKAKLHLTDAEVRALAAQQEWKQALVNRISEVKARVDQVKKLRKSAYRTSREFLLKPVSEKWEAGLTNEDMMTIVCKASSLADNEVGFHNTQEGDFTFYKTKMGSLRVFKGEADLLVREQSSVRKGVEISSASAQVLKLVPYTIPGQIAALQNGVRMLRVLHAYGALPGIQTLPTEPRELELRGEKFLVHYCQHYNQRDLLELISSSDPNPWWSLTPKERAEHAGKLIHALAAIHQPRTNPVTLKKDRIRHGDIKLDNIFADLSSSWNFVIADFDGACWLEDVRARLEGQRTRLKDARGATDEVMAVMYGIATAQCLLVNDIENQLALLKEGDDERFLQAELARDVWQLGSAIIEVLTGYSLVAADEDSSFETGTPREIDKSAMKYARMLLEHTGVPESLINVLMNMYHPDWTRRRSAADLANWYDAAFREGFQEK